MCCSRPCDHELGLHACRNPQPLALHRLRLNRFNFHLGAALPFASLPGLGVVWRPPSDGTGLSAASNAGGQLRTPDPHGWHIDFAAPGFLSRTVFQELIPVENSSPRDVCAIGGVLHRIADARPCCVQLLNGRRNLDGHVVDHADGARDFADHPQCRLWRPALHRCV